MWEQFRCVGSKFEVESYYSKPLSNIWHGHCNYFLCLCHLKLYDSNAKSSLNDITECMLATMHDAAILSKIHISQSKTDPGSVSQHWQYLGRTWMSPTTVKRCPLRSMYVSIHWTASILQCVINSVNATMFIIETASILDLQWAYSTTTSMCTLLLTTHDTTQLHHSLVKVHWVGQLKLLWGKLLDNWFYCYSCKLYSNLLSYWRNRHAANANVCNV